MVTPRHVLDYKIGDDEWGRALYHIPTKSVHTWREEVRTHYGKAEELNFATEDCVGLYISPKLPSQGSGYEISSTGSYDTQTGWDKEELRETLVGLGFDVRYLS